MNTETNGLLRNTKQHNLIENKIVQAYARRPMVMCAMTVSSASLL